MNTLGSRSLTLRSVSEGFSRLLELDQMFSVIANMSIVGEDRIDWDLILLFHEIFFKLQFE